MSIFCCFFGDGVSCLKHFKSGASQYFGARIFTNTFNHNLTESSHGLQRKALAGRMLCRPAQQYHTTLATAAEIAHRILLGAGLVTAMRANVEYLWNRTNMHTEKRG